MGSLAKPRAFSLPPPLPPRAKKEARRLSVQEERLAEEEEDGSGVTVSVRDEVNFSTFFFCFVKVFYFFFYCMESSLPGTQRFSSLFEAKNHSCNYSFIAIRPFVVLI
jgi:hypothetical protein